MKALSINLFWAVITLIILIFSFSILLDVGPEAQPLTISELTNKISAGEVQRIIIAGNDLKIELKDKSLATARKETDSSLSETLRNYGLSDESLRKVNLEVQDESGFEFWLGILVPTLLRSEEHTSELQSQFHLVCRLLL